MCLGDNQLTHLKNCSIGSLEVGGGLELFYNQLTELPPSFGNMTLGAAACVYGNPLASEPRFEQVAVRYTE